MPEKLFEGLIKTPTNITFPKYKVQIVNVDGILTDVSDYTSNVETTHGETDEVASFSFEIDNFKGRFTERFEIGAYVHIYMDYVDGGKKQIKGRIDEINYPLTSRGVIMVIEGRKGSELVDYITSISFDNQYAHDAFKTVIDDFNNQYENDIYTYTNVEDSAIQITANFVNVSSHTILKEIAQRAGMSFFIDDDYGIHAFDTGTKYITDEELIAGDNIIQCPRFFKSILEVYNKYTASTSCMEGLDVIYTSNDYTSQANYWIRNKAVNDNNATSYANLKDTGDKLLTLNKDIEYQGSMTCVGLPNLIPGYNIRCSIPYTPIHGWYKIKRYTHTFNNEGFKTVVELNDIEKGNVEFRKLNQRAIEQVYALKNPNNMTHSYFNDFNTDTGTHNNTSITNGFLVLGTLTDSGTYISDAEILDHNATHVELRVNGTDLNISRFYVQANHGDIPQEVLFSEVGFNGKSGTLKVLTTKGKNLQFTVSFLKSSTYPNPVIDSINLMYKHTVTLSGGEAVYD